MTSNAPRFISAKFNINSNRKMFNVEVAHVKQTHRYKPRFYTNKNLFFVRNIKKNNAKFHNKKMKLNFIKNHRKALARRELRKKKGLFITHHIKPVINRFINNNESSSKQLKIKKKIKFKFSVEKKTQIQEIIKDKIIKNTSNIGEQILHNQINSNLDINEEEYNNFLRNNSTPIKKTKVLNNKNSKYISGRWTINEHKKFLEAIIKYGNDWKEVQKYIGTRSSSQARSHAQKFFIKLKQDQSKSKISDMIDYSNSSIKTFHDTLHSLPSEKKQKIIQELENVVFDKEISNKKRKTQKNLNGKNNFSETNTEIGFISGTDFFEDDTNGLTENNEKNNCKEENFKFLRRKMSIDSLNFEIEVDRRKFLNGIQTYNNGLFTDEEYEKSFHKIFSDKEGNYIESESRKLSIDDDFMFNSINI